MSQKGGLANSVVSEDIIEVRGDGVWLGGDGSNWKLRRMQEVDGMCGCTL